MAEKGNTPTLSDGEAQRIRGLHGPEFEKLLENARSRKGAVSNRRAAAVLSDPTKMRGSDEVK